MAVFTPSYPLTLPTVIGVQTQRFALVRTVAVSTSPFTGQDQVVQHEGEYWTTQIKFPPMLTFPVTSKLPVTLTLSSKLIVPPALLMFTFPLVLDIVFPLILIAPDSIFVPSIIVVFTPSVNVIP